jgi:hypothetical protein
LFQEECVCFPIPVIFSYFFQFGISHGMQVWTKITVKFQHLL